MTERDAAVISADLVPPEPVGCVVIGRNEAERLGECLDSVLAACQDVVYVDSGSTDDSVRIARSRGVPVLELDRSSPFSAARARNEGFAWLGRRSGTPAGFVQFVDGDCRLEPGWLEAAAHALARDPKLAVVTGRTRERSPEHSIYNRLCEIELDAPAGEATECGGVAMMRAASLQAAGAFDPALAAGEEPELCMRLRRLGWRIECLSVPMMQHDLGMHSWRQWWARSMRSGRAYAASAWKHRRGPERYRVREVARILFWGGAVPLFTLVAAVVLGPPALLCLGSYAIPAARAFRWARRRGRGPAESLLYACFSTVGKFAEFFGVLQFCGRQLRRRA